MGVHHHFLVLRFKLYVKCLIVCKCWALRNCIETSAQARADFGSVF